MIIYLSIKQLLTPSTNPQGQFSLLNHTYVEQKLQDKKYISGAAPRWALTAEAYNEDYSGSLYTFFLNTTLEKVNIQ